MSPFDHRNLSGQLLGRHVEDSDLQVVHRFDEPVHDRTTVVHQAVQNAIKQVARAVPHHCFPDPLAGVTIAEQLCQGPQVAAMHSYYVIAAHKDTHLAWYCETGLFVEQGKVKHKEQVVLIFVYFGKLDPAEAIVEGKRMKIVISLKVFHLREGRRPNVYPGDGPLGHLVYV